MGKLIIKYGKKVVIDLVQELFLEIMVLKNCMYQICNIISLYTNEIYSLWQMDSNAKEVISIHKMRIT